MDDIQNPTSTDSGQTSSSHNGIDAIRWSIEPVIHLVIRFRPSCQFFCLHMYLHFAQHIRRYVLVCGFNETSHGIRFGCDIVCKSDVWNKFDNTINDPNNSETWTILLSGNAIKLIQSFHASHICATPNMQVHNICASESLARVFRNRTYEYQTHSVYIRLWLCAALLPPSRHIDRTHSDANTMRNANTRNV